MNSPLVWYLCLLYIVGRQLCVCVHTHLCVRAMLRCGPWRSTNMFQDHGYEDSDQISFTLTNFPDLHHLVVTKECNIFRNCIRSYPQRDGKGPTHLELILILWTGDWEQLFLLNQVTRCLQTFSLEDRSRSSSWQHTAFLNMSRCAKCRNLIIWSAIYCH